MVIVGNAGGDMAKVAGPHRVKVGERFVKYLGQTPVDVVVIEDRGNLGVDGGQVVRIRELVRGPYDEEREYEVPVKDLPALGVPPAAPPPPPRKGRSRAIPAR